MSDIIPFTDRFWHPSCLMNEFIFFFIKWFYHVNLCPSCNCQNVSFLGGVGAPDVEIGSTCARCWWQTLILFRTFLVRKQANTLWFYHWQTSDIKVCRFCLVKKVASETLFTFNVVRFCLTTEWWWCHQCRQGGRVLVHVALLHNTRTGLAWPRQGASIIDLTLSWECNVHDNSGCQQICSMSSLVAIILEWITAHWSFTFWKTNLAKGRIISNPALYADGSSCSVNTQLGSR